MTETPPGLTLLSANANTIYRHIRSWWPDDPFGWINIALRRAATIGDTCGIDENAVLRALWELSDAEVLGVFFAIRIYEKELPPPPGKTTDPTYRRYLSSTKWKERRIAAIDRAQKRCSACSLKSRRLIVHHVNYERIGCELPDDLEVFCPSCHAQKHTAKGAGR